MQWLDKTIQDIKAFDSSFILKTSKEYQQTNDERSPTREVYDKACLLQAETVGGRE